MTSRREFLRYATWAAAPLVSSLPAMSARQSNANYHAILIDDRHSEARLFGSVLAGRGAAIHTVPEGDVTSLWLASIGPAWRRGPVAIAGVTRPPALFCLEQLAWSQGLRVTFHAEQKVTPTQPAHTWARNMAAIALHGANPRIRHWGPTSAGLAPAPTQDAQLLTAWIIAPA